MKNVVFIDDETKKQFPLTLGEEINPTFDNSYGSFPGSIDGEEAILRFTKKDEFFVEFPKQGKCYKY